MAEPTYSSYTERLYLRLPEFFRVADADHGWPLKTYISLVGDVAGEAEELVDDWLDNGTLADPVTAEAEWLPWLAQHVGVALSASLTEAEQRDAIQYASAGWQAGTKLAVANAAKTALTGAKYALVVDHCTSVVAGVPVAGTVWDVCVVTKPTETPDAPAVLAAIVAKGAKPAGVVLHHSLYEATWDQIEAANPTWAHWDGQTWDQLESTA